ncbi:hypothetical protein IFR04_012371 [Cadophora malorum]|uniref:Xylanolytic transcriptional activator regulatory domain-containing protein n=1 Tax=Cadophora malorum TaxID=108018 RepID=A0A8H7W880_9HELO|nr:hypothetical protein IFR04_012371 [Cadophora malorum]
MDHLEAAMCYVGSFYVPQAPTPALGLEAEKSVNSMSCPRDGFKVQAMLLLAIGLDGFGNQEKALEILGEAQNLALELGMHRHEFTSVNGSVLGVLEESWRRTWWELYAVDRMIAGVHRKSPFRMNETAADVALPCEEKEYFSENIPQSHFIEDFDDKALTGDDINFSSYAYRIAAVRNLGRVLKLQQITFLDDPIIDRIDSHLVNWKLHLPYSKKSLLDNEGQLDEMLFQAHMVTEVATILLHRTHSQLDSTPTQPIISCAPHHPVPSGQNYSLHAPLTISSAVSITKLITLPYPLNKAHPFLHLRHNSRINPLNTGALKTLWEVWPCAGRAWEQVSGVVKEIFNAKKAAVEAELWGNFVEDEAMGVSLEGESMIDEFQLASLWCGQNSGGI